MNITMIIGASGGLGGVLAETFARNKFSLILGGYKNIRRLNKISQKLEVYGVKVFAGRIDVRDKKSVKDFFDKGEEENGIPDILINSAGLTRDNLFLKMTPEEWDEVLDVNLKGAFNCSQEAIIRMGKNGGGHIINIGSMSGSCGRIGQANYASAKASLIGFSKSLAMEVGCKNIKVNVIVPGFMETPMTESLPREIFDINIKRSCLSRLTFPQDVAKIVLAITATESISGQVFICDSRTMVSQEED